MSDQSLLVQIAQGVGELVGKVDGINDRLDIQQQRLDTHSSRLDALHDHDVTRVTEEAMSDMSQRINEKLDNITHEQKIQGGKLDDLTTRVTKLEQRKSVWTRFVALCRHVWQSASGRIFMTLGGLLATLVTGWLTGLWHWLGL